MVGDRDKILAAGFDGYIAKPISPETFMREVEEFLQVEQHSIPLPCPQPTVQLSSPLRKVGTLLVVDNSPVNIELARSILEPFGYETIVARGMEEALSLSRRTVLDLILSDVDMGDHSGYDFIKVVKADPQLRAVPFVFITSTFLSAADQARGLSLGAVGFLLRPIDPQVLLARIEAWLRAGKQR